MCMFYWRIEVQLVLLTKITPNKTLLASSMTRIITENETYPTRWRSHQLPPGLRGRSGRTSTRGGECWGAVLATVGGTATRGCTTGRLEGLDLGYLWHGLTGGLACLGDLLHPLLLGIKLSGGRLDGRWESVEWEKFNLKLLVMKKQILYHVFPFPLDL